jgi:co-chaperonin GroES (HSP10)
MGRGRPQRGSLCFLKDLQMSEIILPPGLIVPKSVAQVEQPAEDATPEEKGRALPVPTGYKILCMVPKAEENFDGSILAKPDIVRKNEEYGTTVLFVLALGPDAYKDASKFPSGPYCKEGDFVLVRTYSGTRIKIFGQEFRLLSDDQIEAVVEDPRGISRFAA